MPRFADHVLADPYIEPKFAADLKSCMVIAGDNVADYFFNAQRGDAWDIGDDFPNVAPPFEKFWLDFKAPLTYVNAKGLSVPWDYGERRWGFYCVGERRPGWGWYPRNDAERALYRDGLSNELAELRPIVQSVADKMSQSGGAYTMTQHEAQFVIRYRHLSHMLDFAKKGMWEDIRLSYGELEASEWQLFLTLITDQSDRPHSRAHGPLWHRATANDHIRSVSSRRTVAVWQWSLHIDKMGRVIQVPHNVSDAFFQHHGKYAINHAPHDDMLEGIRRFSGEERAQVMGDTYLGILPYFYAALLTISLMHCKNVPLVAAPQETPPPLKNEAKRRGERRQPYVRFHTLNIEPMMEVLRTAKEEDGTEPKSLQRRLHIRRGHFKDYREGHGLFGKHRGLYFWPERLPGNDVAGLVVKDYAVDKPTRDPVYK